VELVPAWRAFRAVLAAAGGAQAKGQGAERARASATGEGAAELPGQELDDDALLARLEPGDVELPVVVVVNKLDLAPRRAELAVLEELLGEHWPIVGVSALSGEGLAIVRAVAFRALGVIRVYAKPPGKPASTKAPIILREGSTVFDMARFIHKEIEASLRFARVWSSRHFDGQRIPRDAVLQDGDVVELNT
jgi:hypothetical protein